jgi:hypothetical protein
MVPGMSVMELLRGVTSAGEGPGAGRDPLHRPLLAGAGTALASSLVVVLPALVTWVASPQSTVPWTDALGLGGALWLLGGGARLQAGAATVALVPLLLLAAVVGAAAWGAWRTGLDAVDGAARSGHRAGLLRTPVADALVAWAVGYAACTALVALLARLGPAVPVTPTLVLPVLAVPLLAAGLAARRLVAAEPALAGPRWARPRWLPVVVAKAVRPALVGAATMLAAGSALVLVLVVARFGQVAHLHGQLEAGAVGGSVLTLAQVLCLPNAGLWATSFLAGSGFWVVEGAATTWTGSRSGLMPMVPAFGALPDPGAFPGALPVVALVPVAVGVLVGWRAVRSVSRLASGRTKALVTGLAVLLAAAGLAGLDALAGGSLGTGRLGDIGAPAPAMGLTLLAELGAGAALVLAWDRWRLRR